MTNNNNENNRGNCMTDHNKISATRKRIVSGLIIMLLLTLIDQVVKRIIDTTMKVGDSRSVIQDVFHITYVQNKGAAWGSLYGQRILLLIVTCAIFGVMSYLFTKLSKYDSYKDLRILIIFIMAGALGNIIDRCLYGYVIDMFDFCLIHFPVFNVADIYVTCCIILLFILLMFKYKDDELELLFQRKKRAEHKKDGENDI